ncbi:MAG: FMN-binding negative transcriptional regulator [Roseovarius sp.]|uniref:FMN-binding negative transcriptional regulator n=1 Tax=Roseovarius sp. TaxID=1486281 RepID=UPI001B74290F|nr:FMN-binding negative transcriptional regulator [Roseovarius sp.]MBQ0750580.1 FMN-binding negative transcriptional regulator [Roseovarius sp.]MBQ0811314.1 FMN-binding negative transcriptional regulator [Roseovarius sp.]
MHPNPAFRQAPAARNVEFARARGFGILAVCSPEGPLMSHIPFLLNADGTQAEFHLVRSNPIARLLTGPVRARLAIEGPHSYVSPDWYGVEDQVPTWNYVAVHLVGEVTLQPQEGMRDLLDRQSAEFEARLAPKPEWRAEKMTPEVLERMMRQIVPCAMRVDEIAGTWKLGQNKPEEVRLRAADYLGPAGQGQETDLLAEWMRAPPA